MKYLLLIMLLVSPMFFGYDMATGNYLGALINVLLMLYLCTIQIERYKE